MASRISPATTSHNIPFRVVPAKGLSSSLSLRFSDSSHVCLCANSADSKSSAGWTWEAVLNGAVHRVMRSIDVLFNPPSRREREKDGIEEPRSVSGDEDEWDWDRWKQHFVEVDDQERLVSLLKSRLGHAVRKEDYKDAAKLKVAINAATKKDTVAEVMAHLNSAIGEERYKEAAFLCDIAGAGLLGWWSGVSQDSHDPYGVIVQITAEHGKYVARRFSPRQLNTSSPGVPLFEIFLTMNKRGEYRQQAVYLKRKTSQGSEAGTSTSADHSGHLNSSEDDSDVTDLLPGFQNVLHDMVPGFKVKVVKVTAPVKTDKDFIAKFIEQVIDEEDDQDIEIESSDGEEEGKDENTDEQNDGDMSSSETEVVYSDDQTEISVDVVVGGIAENLPGSKEESSYRVPAQLVRNGRKFFTFSLEKDANHLNSERKKSPFLEKKGRAQGERSVDHIMSDLAKLLGKEKIPLKALKDASELILFTLSQAQNRQPLTGMTSFRRIETSFSRDPLNGLYLGANGLYSSEVISLHRKYGQWHDDNGSKKPSNLEFYEYVEAVKLTGDPFVPAGEVAFRAKIGKAYQLPHKGIIPEELGVIARYKGQGRLADPGFKNPRWVDGELVILDGKHIKGGPIVGFVYWAPEYHFLVFFNRLRLQ